MDLEIINSPEFRKDFIDTLKSINEKHNLNIKCGQICYDTELLTIYIEEDEISS